MTRVTIRMNKDGFGREPETVYYQYTPGKRHRFTCGNRYAEASSRVGRFLLVVLAQSPRLVSDETVIELLWGSQANGGPDDASNSVDLIALEARAVGAALGFHIERVHSQGWRADLIKEMEAA